MNQSHPLRILTYNVHGWLGLDGRREWDRIGDVIAKAGADVIGLNEVHQPHPSRPRHGPLDELGRRLDHEHLFGVTIDSSPWPEWAGMAFGNALLSRFPIVDHDSHVLPNRPGIEPRGLLEATLDLSGTEVTVYVTHLHAPATQSAEELRRQQVDAILDIVGDCTPNHIILGDFNSVMPAERRPGEVSGALQPLLDAGYVDAFAVAGEGEGPTFSTDDPRWRIDYIFVAPGLADQLLECRRIDNATVRVASDHFPVMASFRVNGIEFALPGGVKTEDVMRDS
ncbi:MAG: endonuclease/exonuclease/phosphatase family protein [Anaerolineae bacterium]